MTESVWVVLSIEGESSDVLGVFESEEQADELLAITEKYVSVERHQIVRREH